MMFLPSNVSNSKQWEILQIPSTASIFSFTIPKFQYYNHDIFEHFNNFTIIISYDSIPIAECPAAGKILSGEIISLNNFSCLIL